MDPLAFLVFAGITVGLVRLTYFSERRRAARSIKRTPYSKICDLAEGQHGRIVGRVTALLPQDALTSPFTGRTCVYLGVIIQEYANANGWAVISRRVRAVPFVIDDGTGRAVVYFTDAKMDVEIRLVAELTAGIVPDENQAELLRGAGLLNTGRLRQTIRVNECVLEVGATAAVCGAGIREADPDAAAPESYRGEPATRLRLTSSKKHPLVISDSALATSLSS